MGWYARCSQAAERGGKGGGGISRSKRPQHYSLQRVLVEVGEIPLHNCRAAEARVVY